MIKTTLQSMIKRNTTHRKFLRQAWMMRNNNRNRNSNTLKKFSSKNIFNVQPFHKKQQNKFCSSKYLRRNFSTWEYVQTFWPFSSTDPIQSPQPDDNQTNDDNSNNENNTNQQTQEDVPNYTVYKDERDEEYVSDSDFQMRIKSFSWQMLKKYYSKIIYILWKAWIEDNLEYIILLILFFLI